MEDTLTKITCGNAPWNRYVFTRVTKKSFRQNGVLTPEKTVVKEKTNVKNAQTHGHNTERDA